MTTETPSKTEAIRRATNEVGMYRQGDQWVTWSYDHQHEANRLAEPCSYWLAREYVTGQRASRALDYLGYPEDADEGIFHDDLGPGSVRERVNRGLARLAGGAK